MSRPDDAPGAMRFARRFEDAGERACREPEIDPADRSTARRHDDRVSRDFVAERRWRFATGAVLVAVLAGILAELAVAVTAGDTPGWLLAVTVVAVVVLAWLVPEVVREVRARRRAGGRMFYKVMVNAPAASDTEDRVVRTCGLGLGVIASIVLKHRLYETPWQDGHKFWSLAVAGMLLVMAAMAFHALRRPA